MVNRLAREGGIEVPGAQQALSKDSLGEQVHGRL